MPRSITFRSVFDIAGKEKKVARLEKAASAPGFWDDSEKAQLAMQRLAALREEVELWRSLAARVVDSQELLELISPEGEEAMAAEISQEVNDLEKELDRQEFLLLLSGSHDKADAIFAIHAGAGGTDAQDWAEMLLRMYLRWAEARGYKTAMLDSLTGQEAGYKSVTVSVNGRYAFGYLKAERGIHRLVRLSPFDEAHRRHTSFAKMEVWPDIAEEIEIEIKPDDVEMEVFKASGAGGQHVQKNATAVRLTHKPTGIVVSCQNERSQVQNREIAVKILRARLYDLEMQRQAEEMAHLKGENVDAGWGNQIRSYVLHPYKMVKDLRTGCETGNVETVLDGRLDEFIEAYLHSTIGQNDG
jgi:peptide chain release factor 2